MENNNHLTGREATQFKLGSKGGPGRPPKLKTQVKDFFKEHPYAVETLMKVLFEAGIAGDKEAAMYIIDRQKGKPTAKIGLDEADRDLLSIATILEFRKLIDTPKLLEEGYDAIQGEGSNSGGADEEATG